MMGVDSSTDDSTATTTVNGLMSAAGFSGLLGTVQEHVSDLDISMEHVINYGGPGGKVRSLETMANRPAYLRFYEGADCGSEQQLLYVWPDHFTGASTRSIRAHDVMTGCNPAAKYI